MIFIFIPCCERTSHCCGAKSTWYHTINNSKLRPPYAASCSVTTCVIQRSLNRCSIKGLNGPRAASDNPLMVTCRITSACQLFTVAALGARFAAHLPFAMLAQTLAFVMLNKVHPNC